MATLSERLASDLKDALRARDEVRLRTIRSLRAALQEKEIAEREGGFAVLSEESALAVVQKQRKQRLDSIEQFESAGRDDLASREREELAVIERYLPEEMSRDEIRERVREIIEQTGAKGPGDIGRVMGPAMSALRGRADGRTVQQIAREELGSDA